MVSLGSLCDLIYEQSLGFLNLSHLKALLMSQIRETNITCVHHFR